MGGTDGAKRTSSCECLNLLCVREQLCFLFLLFFIFYFLFISLSNRVLLKKAIAHFSSLTEATHKIFPVHDPDQVYQEMNIMKNKTIIVLV